MFGRKRGTWKVRVQAEDGDVQVVSVRAHYDRDYSGLSLLVSAAACVQAWLDGGKQRKYQPAGAIETVEPASMQMAA